MEPYLVDPELLHAFAEEAMRGLDDALPLASELGLAGDDSQRVHAIFRPVHSIKGSAAFFGLMKIQELSHATEELLEELRKKPFFAESALVDVVSSALLEIRAMLYRVKKGGGEVEDEGSYSELLARVTDGAEAEGREVAGEESFLSRLKERLPRQLHPLVLWLKGVLHGQDISLPPLVDEGARVWEMELEEALEASRKLDEASGSLAELADHGQISPLKEAGQEICRLSREVNETLTRIGCTPLNEMREKAGRVASHVAEETGKSVRVLLDGGDGHLLKRISRHMDEAVAHLVRNAVGHGIETEAERVAEGKSPIGRVVVHAVKNGPHLIVRVEDDGSGIDVQRVLERGRELGLVRGNGNPSAEELIFEPGLSTAPEVTEISGRGVGMDIVRRAMEEVGGMVDVTSVNGQGTTFTLTVPLLR